VRLGENSGITLNKSYDFMQPLFFRLILWLTVQENPRGDQQALEIMVFRPGCAAPCEKKRTPGYASAQLWKTGFHASRFRRHNRGADVFMLY